MWRTVVTHRFISWCFAAAFVATFGGWIWIWRALDAVASQLILHYNSFDHYNQFGSLNDLHLVATTACIILFFNMLIAYELDKKEWFLGKLLAVSSVLFGLLIFIAFAAIISVN